MNIYIYEVMMVIEDAEQPAYRQTIYPEIKAISELDAVLKAVELHAPIYKIIRVSRIR